MTAVEWVTLAACAMAVGFAKTGIGGVGTLAVVGFAVVLPPRESTGALLPLLIAADVIAIAVYRRDAKWSLLRRLAPWVALGVVLGVGYLAVADDRLMRPTIAGLVLVGVVAATITLRRRDGDDDLEVEPRPTLGAAIGVAAGFATMVANAAGSLMTLYLLFEGLPVRRFVGTAAWFFFLVNVGKSPFSIGLGLLDGEALGRAALLVPFLAVGAWIGVLVIRRIPQPVFERVALILAAVSALALVL